MTVAAGSRPPAGTIAEETRLYVERHPSIRLALKDDLVNFVQLAQKIGEETGLRQAEAVAMALRRLQRQFQRDSEEQGLVRAVIEGSRLEVHSGVGIVRITEDPATLDRLLAVGARVAPGPGRRPMFQVYQGTRAYTVLCDESILPELTEEVPREAILSSERGLATIAFHSTPKVEETPGVLAAMAEALAARGINCLETVSVHTESIFVFRGADVIRAYQALSELIPAPARGEAEPPRSVTPRAPRADG